jgi:trans-aconitate methyltransferase
MQNYKWDAEDYKMYSKSQQIWAQELINKLNLKGHESVLDIGCGDGKITAEIAALLNSGSITGIDSSSEMIELAKSSFPESRHENLNFIVMNASDMSFEEEFNIVFSNAVLHWIKDHQPVLKGIYNSLKKGGTALLQMGGRGNAEDILAVLDRLIKSEEWRIYFEGFEFPYAFFGLEDYEELIRQSSLSARRIELIPKDMKHDGREGLEGWIRTTWLPYTRRIPEKDRNRFIEHLAVEYLKEYPPDESGSIHIKMSRLEVEVIKP